MATLNLVTTPIGNLDDLTERVGKVLREKRFFLAEDTRQLKMLLGHLGLPVSEYQIVSFHEHSKEKIESLIDRMDQGEDLYLVSDAGSPLISDPAYPLVRAALEHGHQLASFPGATSPIVALELSGLPPQPFHFYGFLARDKGPKRDTLEMVKNMGETHIFFEAPARMEETLCLLAEVAPECRVAVCREISKKFESIHRFKAKDYHCENINYKGEFVLVINTGRGVSHSSEAELQELALKCLKKSSTKNLAKLLGEILGRNSKEIYSELSGS